MKKAFAWLMLLIVMTLFTFSVATSPVRADEVWQPLFAGSPHYYSDWWWMNKMLVGWVHVWNDCDYLYVEYITEGGWELTETHVAVATSFEDIPQTKKGNPKVGHFPYKMTHDPPVTLYTYEIELEWTAGTKLYIAAHAVVQKLIGYDNCDPIYQEETAWANCGGPDAYFPGNNWATYFTYHVQSCID